MAAQREFLLNVGHTIGPIAAAVVLVWVGLWGLLDTFLFPENTSLSAILCLLFATLFAFVLHALPRSISNTPIHVFLSACLGVCYWRGVWKLWETFVVVENPTIQSLSALGTGILILFSTGFFRYNVVGPPILFRENRRETESLFTSHEDLQEEFLEKEPLEDEGITMTSPVRHG